ncbi:hypothetical protein PAECIP111891_00720 [Paenibacillus allorhizoplanae]|uniref:Uncharacterized protein n=1 Tax=Paenibacillus allorhizoplanae TaxID=2905648 RepID=A0ABM9BVU9_9BACL|nr:hypothetical protein PAECIP111891_00720 [Paenibacillus allorhizoplanae]
MMSKEIGRVCRIGTQLKDWSVKENSEHGKFAIKFPRGAHHD